MLKEMLNMLVSVFVKDEDSNIGKLITIASEQLADASETLKTIEEWISIDNAVGKGLDDIGDDLNQYRGKATDEIYRVMIKGKIARSLSDGTINSMIDALSKTLNCSPSEIQLVSSIELGEGEPNAIIVNKAPLNALNKIGLSASQFVQFVEQVVPGDASVSRVNLEGTFSFAIGSDIEVSEDGFADINGATGGTFGGVFTPSEDYILPL
ncbi:hypothetical protein NG54_03455 [Heyndrickxia ginsengihumi]|uniref:DUF2612 domain-containing protein n=1 Tax=Heyndrickxia ginsengihumi TaxID=363870 RepID=A0A0A6VFN5_9BACI|nr:hypothetical protein [Heyndrickxia ginsengihumi]KHD86381.1 hypothetical protein NG54_03455 [Heyndrickxia ginsengihumi]